MKKSFSGHTVFRFMLMLAFAAFCLLGLGSNKVQAEGSPQFKPDTTRTTYLMIINNSAGYGTFAGYSATDTNRLFIRITDPATERIYFGVGQRTSGTTWYFRVKDPNGNVV